MPSLRDLYDAAEKRLTPTIEAVVHSEEFATTTAIIGMVRRGRANASRTPMPRSGIW